MKILITADPELPVPPRLYGGIERIIDLLITGLQNRGHRVALISHPNSSSKAESTFPWPGRQSKSILDTIGNSLALRNAVQSFKPDLLHSFSRIAYLTPLLRSHLPLVMSYQREPSLRTTTWGKQLSRDNLTFTGCSEYICRRGQDNGSTWHPIHNSVVLDKFTFQATIEKDAPLVFLSRIEKIKGAHTAIAIAQQSGRRLIIAGNRVNSSQGEKYWQQEIAPHLNKNGIEYIGAVDDIQKNKLLGEAAAMVVPIEWNEPFGIVFAEALACGTPVISCPRGALPEIVQPGVHGFLIQSISEGIEAVSKLSTISRLACRQRVEACFSSEVIINKYIQLYETAIASRQKS